MRIDGQVTWEVLPFHLSPLYLGGWWAFPDLAETIGIGGLRARGRGSGAFHLAIRSLGGATLLDLWGG